MPDEPRSPREAAALLLVGDELLSGRTRDANLMALATTLGKRGIDVDEVRIVGDRDTAIIEAVDALRHRYRYVFTSGGIGPTHDDVTTDAVAAAFGRSVEVHPDAEARLEAFWAARDIEPNAARRRMARIPDGAVLIDNDQSAAPGFRLENVYVMAGVPSIFANMLSHVVHELHAGPRWCSVSVHTRLGEGSVAEALGRLQEAWPDARFGSYPGDRADRGLVLVGRTRRAERLGALGDALETLVRRQGGTVLERETDENPDD